MNLSEELEWRGFVNQTTYKSVSDIDTSHITFYWGVDPSAPSMTIGNLAAAMMVRHFIEHGHKAVLLIGGATGMIGDPDGKNEERNLRPVEEIQTSKTAIAEQYKTLFNGKDFTVVDNYDWFRDMGYLEFLRHVGKNVPMRQMLGRDFVVKRLAENGGGISYAEFSYVLIQAYDFLHMNREMGVTLQVCGSDQWGNSVAGVDLIRRLTGKEAHVWSAPLVINKATGVKFGKTEDGAIWLDKKLTSVYKFYQFWLNVDDEGVEDYLKIYTLISRAEIDKILVEFKQKPGERLAQKTLAYEVTKIVHGEQQAKVQVKLSDALFKTKDFHDFSEVEFKELEHELPFVEVNEGDSYLEALVSLGLAKSNTEARRLISDNAVNNSGLYDITSSETSIHKKDGLAGYQVIIKGKKHLGLLKIK